jgi:hypothetical protein
MRGGYCYLPILPARGGAFRAVGAISPEARSRLAPLFNVPAPALKDGQTLDAYLAKRAEGIHGCWDTERPVYVDVHDLSPELRTSTGTQPIAYLLEQLLMRGSRAIAVTGTEITRGAEYLDAIRGLICQSRDGLCLRLARDELDEPKVLYSRISALLDFLALSPAAVDVVLDFEYVGKDAIESLRATALEALQSIHRIGSFRNIVVSGTSVPEQLNKRTQGKIVRVPRVELPVWIQVIGTFAEPVSIGFSDCGVIGAYYAPPGKPVNAPSRSRYTTATEHVFRRANRNEYSAICRDLLNTKDFSGPNFSRGDQQMSRSGNGHTGPGNPGMWVSNDTNHHLELVSTQVWNILRQHGFDSRFALPKPKSRPWLQADLLSH